jgi:aspartate 4-decarboxylase
MEHPAGLGGMPKASGIAQRMETWLAKHSDMPGASLLQEMVPFAIKTFGFEPEYFLHEYRASKG